MMTTSMPKYERVLDGMTDVAGPVTKPVAVKEENEVMEVVDVTEPARSFDLGLQGVDRMREMQGLKYFI